MRLVPRYTIVLGATATVALAVIGWFRLQATRSEYEHDMRRDHRMVGRVLETGISDLWRAASEGKESDKPALRERATRDTLALLDRSTREVRSTRFDWDPTDHSGLEAQHPVGDEFVSRFPVHVGTRPIGAVVARESLEQIEDAVRGQLWFTIGGIVLVMAVFGVASMVMGSWLVGRPVAALVAHARRIGRGDLSSDLRVKRNDELGMLANELQSASHTLSESLAKTAAETEARMRTVEQLRHQDRLATVGKLAAGIAHELGTPLSVVSGHAQMIADREVTGDSALESARAIDREVTRMGKIVRQLLDFARRKGPEGTTCDPAEVARRATSLLAVMAERHGVQCAVRDVTPPTRANIDEDSLHQVLTNLIVNGIQAMPKGGALDVAVTRATTAKDAEPPHPCVRIDVRDGGPGIPPDVQAHMFEPFFTTKEPGEGTGLGLAVVHGIVVDHGGWITVDSSARGSVFSLFLEEAV